MKQSAIIFLTKTILVFTVTYGSAIAQPQNAKSAIENNKVTENLKLKVSVGGKQIFASFVDSKVTADFIKMLPLTITMDDLKSREKYASLPIEFAEGGAASKTYQIGDISYWLGGGIAVFYDQDGQQVSAGLIPLAHISSGIEVFNAPGSMRVMFEAVKK